MSSRAAAVVSALTTTVLALAASSGTAAARPRACIVALEDASHELTASGVGPEVGAAEGIAWANACTLHRLAGGCRDELALVSRNVTSKWTRESSRATVELATRRRVGGYGEGEDAAAACERASERACAALGATPCPTFADAKGATAEAARWDFEVPRAGPWVCVAALSDERKLERIRTVAPTEELARDELVRRAPSDALPTLAGGTSEAGWVLRTSVHIERVHEDDWKQVELVLERGGKRTLGSAAGATREAACAEARAQACRAAKVEPCADGPAVTLTVTSAPRP